MPCGIATTFTLWRDLACVDVDISVRDKPADPWPEAGWLCLPLAVEKPSFRLARIGSVVDPARDLVPGSNRDLFWLSGGVAVIDDAGVGIGLCPIDSPCVSLDRPGLWSYRPEFVPQRPRVYVNLFNNQWTTNFRLWNEGSWSSRVRLWSIDRYRHEPSLVTPSTDARYPLCAAAERGPAGDQLVRRSGPTLSRRGVLVTAWQRDADAKTTLLRLWELAGQSGACRVELPPGVDVRSVHRLDLRGRPLGDARPIVDGKIDVELRPFAPVTLLLGD